MPQRQLRGSLAILAMAGAHFVFSAEGGQSSPPQVAKKENMKVGGAAEVFVIREDLVEDTSTSLLWAKNASMGKMDMDWNTAKDWVEGLKLGGRSNWRMPTKDELRGLAIMGGDRPYVALKAAGFEDIKLFKYWTSSEEQEESGQFWTVDMEDGFVASHDKSFGLAVWPVCNIR